MLGTGVLIKQTIVGGRPQVAGVARAGAAGPGTAHGSMSRVPAPPVRWAVTVIVWLPGEGAGLAWVAAKAGAAPAAEVSTAPPAAMTPIAAVASARLNRDTATRPLAGAGSYLGLAARVCGKSRT
jgi:hypothetical protein